MILKYLSYDILGKNYVIMTFIELKKTYENNKDRNLFRRVNYSKIFFQIAYLL